MRIVSLISTVRTLARSPGRGFVAAVFAATLLPAVGCKDNAATTPPPPDLEHTRATGEVRLAEGAIRGLQTKSGDDPNRRGAWAFTGIPFAEAITPETRWSAPVAKRAWKPATLDATQPGLACPQPNLPHKKQLGLNVAQGEDCLNLSVWTPAHVPEKTPVMVFIYGGAFLAGSQQTDVYNGSYIASHTNTIVVAINYRVGALGFLRLPEAGMHGNYGFLDQQLALQWVRSNIASFGGDPENITIFGESAGAMSVGLHVGSAPKSRGLFRAAIMQSNPVALAYKTKAQSGEISAAYAKAVGCGDVSELKDTKDTKDTKDAKQAKALAKCLRGLPLEKVQAGEVSLRAILADLAQGFHTALPWAPTVDGEVIDMNPIAAADAGRFNTPIILGTNKNEGLFFADAINEIVPISALEYEGILTAMFGVDNLIKIQEQERYRPALLGSNRDQLSRAITDYIFVCANRHVADRSTAPTFVYHFVYPTSINFWPPVPACNGKVCHGDELPFVFHNPYDAGNGRHKFTPGELAVSDAFVEYWSNFAAHGDPGGSSGRPSVDDAAKNKASDERPAWTRYTRTDRPVMSLGRKIEVLTPDPFGDLCRVWDEIGYETAGAASGPIKNQSKSP
ncbi:MAG: carboxylesterase family protein [bacterium]|nr:carboxylesterase family protein [bacterium]